jgi:hypothetical protein
MLTFDSWAGRTPRQRLELAAQCAASRPAYPPTPPPIHPSIHPSIHPLIHPPSTHLHLHLHLHPHLYLHLHIATCRRTRPAAARPAATHPAAARPAAARAAAGCPTAGRPARAPVPPPPSPPALHRMHLCLGSLTPPRARCRTHAAPCVLWQEAGPPAKAAVRSAAHHLTPHRERRPDWHTAVAALRAGLVWRRLARCRRLRDTAATRRAARRHGGWCAAGLRGAGEA